MTSCLMPMIRTLLSVPLLAAIAGCSLIQVQLHPRLQPSDAQEVLQAWKPGSRFTDISPYPPPETPLEQAQRLKAPPGSLPLDTAINLDRPQDLTLRHLDRLIGPSPRSVVDQSRVLFFLPIDRFPDQGSARHHASESLYTALVRALANTYAPDAVAAVGTRRPASQAYGHGRKQAAPSLYASIVSDKLGCSRARPCEMPLPSAESAMATPDTKIRAGRAPLYLGGHPAWVVELPAPEPIPTPEAWRVTDAHYLAGKGRFQRAIAAELPPYAFLLEGRCEPECVDGPIRAPVFINREGGRYFVLNGPAHPVAPVPPIRPQERQTR